MWNEGGRRIMICNKCNHKLPDDSEFCQYCGNKIEKQTTETPEKFNNMTPDKVLNTVIDMQAQETVKTMENNFVSQPNHENEEDFGLTPHMPIYTSALKSVSGEMEYLNKLYTTTGAKIKWNRRASVSVKDINGVVDVYDTYLPSGRLYKTIYINMYGAYESEKAPVGFVLNDAPYKKVCRLKKEKVSKTKYCRLCGNEIDSKSGKCTGCGKKYSKTVYKLLGIVLGVIALLSGYFGVNYFNAMSAMNNQDFRKAQQCFDNLYIGEKLFSAKSDYIKAGVLMENGKYVEALRAFNRVKGMPVPDTIIDSLETKIYSLGQLAYRNGNFDDAKKCFDAITDYKRSDDYLFLISCNGEDFGHYVAATNNSKRLFDLIGFEDANEVIMIYLLEEFLDGSWEDGSYYKPYYFILDNDESEVRYNLPSKDVDGYYDFVKDIMVVEKSNNTDVKLFSFEIINEDTISVYCYKDGSTHKLYRQ